MRHNHPLCDILGKYFNALPNTHKQYEDVVSIPKNTLLTLTFTAYFWLVSHRGLPGKYFNLCMKFIQLPYKFTSEMKGKQMIRILLLEIMLAECLKCQLFPKFTI